MNRNSERTPQVNSLEAVEKERSSYLKQISEIKRSLAVFNLGLSESALERKEEQVKELNEKVKECDEKISKLKNNK